LSALVLDIDIDANGSAIVGPSGFILKGAGRVMGPLGPSIGMATTEDILTKAPDGHPFVEGPGAGSKRIEQAPVATQPELERIIAARLRKSAVATHGPQSTIGVLQQSLLVIARRTDEVLTEMGHSENQTRPHLYRLP